MLPRVFARPLELHKGQPIGAAQVVDRLNDLGYAQRSAVERPGQFAVTAGAVRLIPRGGNRTGQRIRIAFEQPRAKSAGVPTTARGRISGIEATGTKTDSVTLDPPLLTAFMSANREKRRQVALAAIPPRMVRGGHRDRRPPVLRASRGRSDPHAGAMMSNLRGRRRYLEGASTMTQQLARNFFLTEALAREAQRPALVEPQAARAVHVADPRAEGDQGGDPRAVPERRLSGTARLVRGARRRGGRAALLCEGHQQHLAGRSGDDRGSHPVAGRVVALPLARARERAAERGASRDGRRRVHIRRGRVTREHRARAGGRSGRSSRRRPISSILSARR